MGDTFADSVQQIVPGRIISPTQRLLKSKSIRRTMALEDQAAQAEQCSAVVAPVVKPFFKRSQHRIGHHSRHFCQQVAGELRLDVIANHVGQAFCS